MKLYAVRSKDGKYFRAKGYGGYGESWVDDIKNARLYKKLSQAYKQFMPGAINVILLTSDWADDIEDFESALLGHTYEDRTIIPPQIGRKTNGFWSANKHFDSNVVGWFNFDCRNDYVDFKMYYRENCEVPQSVIEAFEPSL